MKAADCKNKYSVDSILKKDNPLYLTLIGNGAIKKIYQSFFIFLLMFTSLMFKIQEVQATGTPAGTTVSNQATASYNDDSGEIFDSTSNLVDIIVDSIYSFILEPTSTNTTTDVLAQTNPGQMQNAIAGTIVYYPYTLTNTGNGPDSFSLVKTFGLVNVNTFNPVGGGTGGINGVQIYDDVNGNGIIDVGDLLLISNIGPIGPDIQEKIIVTYQVPVTATSGQIANVDLQATSVGDVTKTDIRNYNKTTVVSDAVITVAKSVNKVVADPLADLTYSFLISNTGNNKANPVVITDAIPTNTTYVVGSEVTVTNGTFTFSSTGIGGPYTYTPVGITDPAVTHVRFTYSDATNGFPLANTRNVSFKVRVNANAINVNITNSGSFDYTPASGVPVTNTKTNEVLTQVSLKSASQISFSGTPFTGQITSGTESTSTDTTTQASAPTGTYVYFRNVITNNGNATDIFNISLDASTFPAGTSVTFFHLTDPNPGTPGNNTSPLLDTTNDSILDTGPIASGNSLTIVSKFFIPANASIGGTATIKATSTNGGSSLGVVPGQMVSDVTLDTLTSVISPSVLLQNIIDGVPSALTVSQTESLSGATVSYPLKITNTSASSDTFIISAGTVTGIPGANVIFFHTVTQTTLAFSASAGASSVTLTSSTGFIATDKIIINGQTLTIASVVGNVISFAAGNTLVNAVAANSTVVEPGSVSFNSTGLMAAGANMDLIATVSIPAGATPYSTVDNLTLTATSTNDSSKNSSVIDSLIVPIFRTFSLVLNRSGPVSPGGVVFYDHIITNTGNVSEAFNLSVPSPGSQGFLYLIQDGTTNAVISVSPAIAPGASYTLKLKVICPPGTPFGKIENAVITAQETVLLASLTNTDTTTVVNSFITLVKSVVNKGPLGMATLPGSSAMPNDIIEYTIQYSNVGSTEARVVKIIDAIPTFTTYVAGSLKINGIVKTDVLDAEGPTGSADYNVTNPNGVVFNIGTVIPGGTGSVKFRIRFN